MVAKHEKEVKYKSANICNTSCLQGLLHAFNFIFIITGIGILALSVWTIVAKMEFVAILGSSYYYAIIIILIFAGLLVLLTGILGCVGTFQKNTSLLFWYLIFILLIFLLQLVAGILAFVYHETLHDELSKTMLSNLNENYNQTGQEALTNAVDLMQQEFHCCGVIGYTDWLNSTFVTNSAKNLHLKTPISCCKTPSFDCSKRDHPSNIYRVLGSTSMGCLIQLELYVREHIFIIAVIAVSVAFFELFVLLVGFSLRQKIQIENNQPY